MAFSFRALSLILSASLPSTTQLFRTLRYISIRRFTVARRRKDSKRTQKLREELEREERKGRPRVEKSRYFVPDNPEWWVTTVEKLDIEGRGFAHTRDGKVLLLEGALPGERVKFSVRQVRPDYNEGRVEEILKRSPARVTPKCPHFESCGGCTLMNLAPEAQVQAKQQQLQDTLHRIGKASPETLLPPVVGSPWNYRYRARLSARYVWQKGRVVIGFIEKRFSETKVAHLTRCEVLHPKLSALLPELSEVLTATSAFKHIPQVEVSAGDSEVALVIRHMTPLSAEDKSLLTDFAAAHTLTVYLQPGGVDSVTLLYRPAALGDCSQLNGARTLSYSHSAHQTTLYHGPNQFVQINPEVNRLLVTRVIELLQLTHDDYVLDLFCGIGNFSLPIARYCRGVTGVEFEASVVETAQQNAMANGLATRATFLACDLLPKKDIFDRLPDWATALQGKVTKMVLDPPRSGALAVVRQIVRHLAPSKVVYVSCNMGSLARDTAVLVGQLGYKLTAAGVADMFPHTAHVECIAVFTK